ncbi:MAG: CARDB domain-containing protein [bacterium]
MQRQFPERLCRAGKSGLFFFVTFLGLTSLAFGQQGQALIKITVEDGKISVQNVDGRAIPEGRLSGRAVPESPGSQAALGYDEGLEDFWRGTAEFSDSDFDALSAWTTSGDLPNLTLDRVKTNWEFDRETCVLKINSRVINTGTAEAGASKLGYYLSADRPIRESDSRIGDDAITDLAPGAFDDETFVADLDDVVGDPPFDRDGAFFIGWIVDYKHQVKESKEKDNRLNSKKSITCGEQPNLTLDLDHTEWSFDAETCSLHVHSRVLNDGKGKAGSSRLGYYLSKDTSIRKVKDHRIGEDFVGSLEPDEFSRERFWVDLDEVRGVPPFDKDGTFFLGWIVDYQNSVHETDEGDNRFHSDTTITCDDGGDLAPLAGNAGDLTDGRLTPETFQLAQNYPNPFNPETTIQFRLAEVSQVTLKVYDLLGREVRTLVTETRPAGSYRVQWDGRDDRGNLLASSVYIYKLQAGEFTSVRTMVFMK